MAIIRVLKDKNNPYVMIDKTCLQDKMLSWKAKGLHTYLMSLPNDWKIYIEDLKNRSKDGRDATSNILRELIAKGYIKRVARRDDLTNKLLGGFDYEVYEVPLDNPQMLKPRKSGNPKTEKPENREVRKSGNPTLLNNKDKLNNELKLNITENDWDINLGRPSGKNTESDSVKIPHPVQYKYHNKDSSIIDNKIYSRVIDRLNEISNKNYRSTTPKTQNCIQSRLKEGFKEDDFYRVIENKKDWLGTDMDKYFRPETLFSNKFEGYLNEKPAKKKNEQKEDNNFYPKIEFEKI